MDKPATSDEQEELLQTLILKLPGIHTPQRLEEITLLSIDMMLQPPVNGALREGLRRRARQICATVNPDHSSAVQHNEMHAAAKACIDLLRAAKEQRLPTDDAGDWAQAKDGKFQPRLRKNPAEGRGLILTGAVMVGLIVAIGGWILWSRSQDKGPDTATESDRFIAQLVASAQGNAPPSHMFGGPIRVTAMNGVPVVIAEQVPPRICGASGMKLVKKGLLSVNGTTPTRVSSAIITELCNKEGGGNATIMWAPK